MAAGQGEAMSAPSKEDVEFWNAVNACVAACGGDTGRVTMARMNAVAAVESSRRKLVVENERLRAERAECIALLEDAKPNEYGEQHAAEWRRKRSALVAKLRGQS